MIRTTKVNEAILTLYSQNEFDSPEGIIKIILEDLDKIFPKEEAAELNKTLNTRLKIYKRAGFKHKLWRDRTIHERIIYYLKTQNWSKAKKDINPELRLIGYVKEGFTAEALQDKDSRIRLAAYLSLGFYTSIKKEGRPRIEAFEDASKTIRLTAYRQLGWPKAALEDVDPGIRYEAKLRFGFKPEDTADVNHHIRMTAYLQFGFTEEAKNDVCNEIARAAYLTLGWDKSALVRFKDHPRFYFEAAVMLYKKGIINEEDIDLDLINPSDYIYLSPLLSNSKLTPKFFDEMYKALLYDPSLYILLTKKDVIKFKLMGKDLSKIEKEFEKKHNKKYVKYKAAERANETLKLRKKVAEYCGTEVKDLTQYLNQL